MILHRANYDRIMLMNENFVLLNRKKYLLCNSYLYVKCVIRYCVSNILRNS